ncbi:MAG: adenosine deaminase [Acidaminococcaceae bacterium]|nr:adenosine deaminase [Acidaminococcaceae bacterium]
MADNSSLAIAKSGKKDEFYTQYSDIEAEMNAYVEYNPNVFRDKTILLPCDDPEWSNFTKYFACNFERFGLKKLISTSYARGAGNKQLTLFEENSPLYDAKKHDTHGKLFTLTHDTDGSGNIDTDDIEFLGYLEGDGDFRSEEVTKLRDEADIIITNPPFSQFGDFLAWIMEAKKSFIIISNQNAISLKDVFPLFKNNEIWLGQGFKGNVGYFIAPEYEDYAIAGQHKEGFIRVSGVMWVTNIDLGKRHEILKLDTMAHNLKYNKKLRKKLEEADAPLEYPKYVNYDAIDVPFTECIPSDYDSLMGVPISFMYKYNPDQFEIIGISLEVAEPMKKFAKKGTFLQGGNRFYTTLLTASDKQNGYLYHREYDRILIRPRKGGNS